MDNTVTRDTKAPFNDQERLIFIVYILQLIGLVFPLLYIVAIIINYIKKADFQNSWLISHNRWQIRTFWFALLWAIIGGITYIIGIGIIILAINSLWMLYRVIKGLIYLFDRKDVYNPHLSYAENK